ncbi:MAG TPA: response regulator [Flavipsychrobacter sp.]|nr:response regulator [Flavipsychrobacter sp.]
MPSTGMPPTIQCLLIDDDQDDQEIFIMCLESLSDHISCLAKSDGAEAIELFNAHIGYVPDYIFLDVNMPKMNGIECLRLLKNIDRLKSTKIFMYSTISEGDTLSESVKLGAEDFIVKPTKAADLKNRLAAIFKTID